MGIEITAHAKKRMRDYLISEELLHNTIQKPDNVVDGYGGRRVYQKKLDGYVLRIIIEERKGVKRVITTYKARSARYEI